MAAYICPICDKRIERKTDAEAAFFFVCHIAKEHMEFKKE